VGGLGNLAVRRRSLRDGVSFGMDRGVFGVRDCEVAEELGGRCDVVKWKLR